jgi:hypothetical protein
MSSSSLLYRGSQGHLHFTEVRLALLYHTETSCSILPYTEVVRTNSSNYTEVVRTSSSILYRGNSDLLFSTIL